MSVLSQPFITPSACLLGFCETTDGKEILRSSSSVHPRNEDDLLGAEGRKKKQELDDLLSEAMSGLTFEERQHNQEILHGVVQAATEEKDFLDRALKQLDQHLSSSSSTRHVESAYKKAERMNPAYVHARAFRVMFLRANDYDPKASADQMLRFFVQKQELFGAEKLVKDITIDDLNDDDMVCLKAGGVQLLGKDRSNRPMFLYGCGVFGEFPEKNSRQELRVQFFMVMQTLQSEETQLRGTISIWYAAGDCRSKAKGRKRWHEYFAAARALPQKKGAIHLCVEAPPLMMNSAIELMKATMRARFLIHYGSPIECHYQLATYGIASQLLPIDAEGRLVLDRHLHWVEACCAKDSTTFNRPISLQAPTDACCTTSRPMDVLFTGAKVSFTEGNKSFLALVQDNLHVYDTGSTTKKQQVVDEIIDKIHESGGRFLRRQTGPSTLLSWEEVPLADLRKKVVESFRNRRRRRNRRRQDVSK